MFFLLRQLLHNLNFFASSPDRVLPYDRHKNSAQNLFYKVKLTRQEIVEEKYLRIITIFNGFKGFDSIEI
jgi:hypothetical protein